MLEARERKRHTVIDLDYRPTFWPSEEAASREIGAAIDHATVAVGNRRECEVAVGTGDPDAAADALLERGIELAIVKLGGDGVLVATPRRADTGRSRSRSRSSAASAPATRSAARSATACSRAATRPRRSGSRMPPGRSSRRGCSAPTRCRPAAEVRELLAGERVPARDA